MTCSDTDVPSLKTSSIPLGDVPVAPSTPVITKIEVIGVALNSAFITIQSDGADTCSLSGSAASANRTQVGNTVLLLLAPGVLPAATSTLTPSCKNQGGAAVDGDTIVVNNGNATDSALPNVVLQLGDVIFDTASSGAFDFPKLTHVAGSITINGNATAPNGAITFDVLNEVAGDVSAATATSPGFVLQVGSTDTTTAGLDLAIGGGLSVTSTNLGSLQAKRITTIAGDLSVVSNANLGNIDMRSLTDVNGNFTIQSNASLGSANFQNLTSMNVNKRFVVINNQPPSAGLSCTDIAKIYCHMGTGARDSNPTVNDGTANACTAEVTPTCTQ
jgi:hypothetical protein